ncbi:HAMP domain-containing histidine kinase [bacterium]|nr:MAG: HAMP domain-containing histidine kinase [bacterium]
MSLRVKLALALAAMALAGVAAATALMVGMQDSAQRAAEAETLRVLDDGVRRAAQESLLAQDPLVLLDHLAHLRRDRPEVAGCRALVSGSWKDVGGAPAADAGAPRRLSASAPDGAEAAAEVLLADRFLAERRAERRRELVGRALRAGGGAAAAGLFAAFLLSEPLTRRIVRIERAVALIGEGKLGAEADVAGSDEVARLARGVNAMSARLKELDAMKRLFVASVTHELRSPLGAIQAQAAELASSGAVPPGERDMLARIQRNAARLEHFVASLLEMARIERGELEFTPKPAALGPIVEDAVLFFTARAREAGLTLTSVIDPALPEARLDADLATQAVTNLVSNALKYTPQGGRVEVCAKAAAGALEVAVKDSGVGIPAEALSRLFAPFERVKNPLNAQGVGLGLAITKAIMDKHGGSVSVVSEPGRGSTFSLKFPLR